MCLYLSQVALIDDKPKDFADCVKWARLYWEESYANQIKQLLYNFPPNQITSSGQPFWSGPKRCPQPLVFDINDPMHVDYVYAAANLRAEVYGLPQVRDRDAIIAMVQQIQVSTILKCQTGVYVLMLLVSQVAKEGLSQAIYLEMMT